MSTQVLSNMVLLLFYCCFVCFIVWFVHVYVVIVFRCLSLMFWSFLLIFTLFCSLMLCLLFCLHVVIKVVCCTP